MQSRSKGRKVEPFLSMSVVMWFGDRWCWKADEDTAETSGKALCTDVRLHADRDCRQSSQGGGTAGLVHHRRWKLDKHVGWLVDRLIWVRQWSSWNNISIVMFWTSCGSGDTAVKPISEETEIRTVTATINLPSRINEVFWIWTELNWICLSVLETFIPTGN